MMRAYTEAEPAALIAESKREIDRMRKILATGSVAPGWAKSYESEIFRHQVFVAAMESIGSGSLKLPNEVSEDDAEYCYEKPKSCREGATWMLGEVKRLNATAPPVAALKLPDGWKLVPIEPDREMLREFFYSDRYEWRSEHKDGLECYYHDNVLRIWRGMLAAATEPSIMRNIEEAK